MPAPQLEYAVHVADGIPTTTNDVPPDLDKRMWSPTSATLITGEPRAVVAGHKDPSASNDPEIIAATRGYIRDFEVGIAATSTALELYSYMCERYPKRINPGALWGSARAAKKPGSSAHERRDHGSTS